jgi:hypothetical protein
MNVKSLPERKKNAQGKPDYIFCHLLSHVSIGKVCAIMPATATQYSTCLGHLGRCDTDRIVSISCSVAQHGQGKYCFVSLSLTVLLTNFANVNNPLVWSN